MLYLEDRQITFEQEYQTLASIAGAIFGGKKKGSAPDVFVPKSAAELTSAMAKVVGGKR